jgi:hypothetical protein
MEFTNNDAKVDVVLSDMYVGGRLLARVQAERRYIVIQKLKESPTEDQTKEPDEEVVVEGVDTADRRTLLQSKAHYKHLLTLQPKKDGQDYVVSEKRVLSNHSEEDLQIIKSKYNILCIINAGSVLTHCFVLFSLQ